MISSLKTILSSDSDKGTQTPYKRPLPALWHSHHPNLTSAPKSLASAKLLARRGQPPLGNPSRTGALASPQNRGAGSPWEERPNQVSRGKSWRVLPHNHPSASLPPERTFIMENAAAAQVRPALTGTPERIRWQAWAGPSPMPLCRAPSARRASGQARAPNPTGVLLRGKPRRGMSNSQTCLNARNSQPACAV